MREKSREKTSRHDGSHSRVLSPLTRKCAERTHERRLSQGNIKHRSRKSSSPCLRNRSSRVKPRRSSSNRRSGSRVRAGSPRSNSPRGSSPRTRKIVLLSPVRNRKSIRDIINEQKNYKRPRERESRAESKSPVPAKKRVKDRLGVRKLDPKEIEIYNMDPTYGRCGAVAVVKEYIDLKSGIMELKT